MNALCALARCRRVSAYSSSAAVVLLKTQRFSTSRRVRRPDVQFDFKTDVLIVGSGAAGLTAALRAHSLGLRPLVIEKNAKIGGTSLLSGGGLWIPLNHVSLATGAKDDRNAALKYIDAVVGDAGPASSRERRAAFVDHGPEMVSFLADEGFRWQATVGYSDYYPHLPGGRVGDRGVEGDVFDLRKLGTWRDALIKPEGGPVPPMLSPDANRLLRMRSGWADFWFSIRLITRLGYKFVSGHHVSMGRSLVAQLLHLNVQRDLPIWRETSLVELITGPDGAVVGAKVRKDGQVKTIGAEKGVLLCAGGFTHNKALREKWGPSPASTEWTLAQPGDTGDAILAGIKAGAATALLDDAWWGPIAKDPVTGRSHFILFERARPFSITVDQSGQRFLNESEPYTDWGHHVYERNKKVKAIPAWMILDQNFRQRYALGTAMARQSLKKAVENGLVIQSDTIEGLCEQTGIDAAGLKDTLARFNDMARIGKDTDFGRGNNAYDRMFGDPAIGPNPSLGPVGRPPYYAVRLWPGDLGTKGGLLTDEAARVVRDDGSVIKGLYAAGNTSASVMGRSYAGAGSTLGPAMTFAFVAANDMARASR